MDQIGSGEIADHQSWQRRPQVSHDQGVRQLKQSVLWRCAQVGHTEHVLEVPEEKYGAPVAPPPQQLEQGNGPKPLVRVYKRHAHRARFPCERLVQTTTNDTEIRVSVGRAQA
jgi:hypothetical protein